MLLNTLFKHWSYRIFAPGTLLREKYEALKRLLRYDIDCHEQMADFQELLHGEQYLDLAGIRLRFTRFSAEVAGMIDALDTMAPGRFPSLKDYHRKFDFYTRFLLAPPKIDAGPPFVLSLQEVNTNSKNIGNKARHLGIVQHNLDCPVPPGFAITTNGYHYFIENNDLRPQIDTLLAQVDIESHHSLQHVSKSLMELIRKAEVPRDLESEIHNAVDAWQQNNRRIEVAVRSSAVNEDAEFSFAGQYDTLLHITRDNITSAYKEVLASKYSPESISYRIRRGLGDEETAMSVLVQEMVNAEYSGVLYTSGIIHDADQDHLHLHVTKGLGEQLVGGAVIPEHYVISRHTPPVIRCPETESPSLTDDQVCEITRWGLAIEKLFGHLQDIEWALDGSGQLYILQARQLHNATPNEGTAADIIEHGHHEIILEGCERGSSGVGSGRIYLLSNGRRLEDMPMGAVLVTDNTPADLAGILHRVAAVLSQKGSRASHFATVARESRIPFLTGITDANSRFEHDSTVTVDGSRGVVYHGKVDSLLRQDSSSSSKNTYNKTLKDVLKFITPLELIDPQDENFSPEGCRSMHDIIRFCHEKALLSMFSAGRPVTGRGALRLIADISLDVFLFDVDGGLDLEKLTKQGAPLAAVTCLPFQALWQGLSHPDVQWKQKPFDWEAYDKIELAGGVPPRKDSFAFASYAVIGSDYLHFNIRFGYHFTIVDVLCGEDSDKNHCMLRFAGGGGDYHQRSLRINFLTQILEQLDFLVEKKGDLLEARILKIENVLLRRKLDMLGRLLGATKLMDMVLRDEEMVSQCVDEFFKGNYSFSQEG